MMIELESLFEKVFKTRAESIMRLKITQVTSLKWDQMTQNLLLLIIIENQPIFHNLEKKIYPRGDF